MRTLIVPCRQCVMKPDQRTHADHHEAHRDGGLGLDVKDVEEHRHGEDRSATAENSEHEAYAEREQSAEWGHGSCRSTRATSSSTISAPRSRMQRQWPSGHCVDRDGRTAGSRDRARRQCVSRGASGPNPNSGTVGPNTVTVGVSDGRREVLR